MIARGGLSFHPSFSGSPPAYQHHAFLFPEIAVSLLSMSREESLPRRKPENVVLPPFLQDVCLGRQCGVTATDDSKHQRSWPHLPKDHPYLPGQSQCVLSVTTHIVSLAHHQEQKCHPSQSLGGCSSVFKNKVLTFMLIK